MAPYTLEQIEIALEAAIDADDAPRIALLSADMDARETAKATPGLLSSALWYASVGLHVFPLAPGAKIPRAGSHGCKDATTDPELVTRWWSARPDANVAIATGHLVDVVDVDGLVGQTSRADLWCEHCEEPRCDHTGKGTIFATIERDSVGKVLTPRQGGMHLYVPATGDGNKANIFPGVDYRGVGGYVVAPPSRNDAGVIYTWLGVPDFTRLGPP